MVKKIKSFEPNKYPLTSGTRFIEASAGTGKTFSLAHLVLRLLTEKECPIEKILVVSFTEATASEIKARIIERLILALRIIESKDITNDSSKIDEVLKEWFELNVKSREQGIHFASIILEALERIENADITTIHGFCSRTIHRESIENGNHFNVKIEKDSYTLINEIVEEYWKKEILEINIPDLRGIFKTNFNRKNLIQVITILENDANNLFTKTFNDLDINAKLSNQLANYIDILWYKFKQLWWSDGSNLEESFIEIANNLKSSGILDTKPYSSKPKKNRNELLTNWINKYKENERPSYDDIQNQDLINKYYHPKHIHQINTKFDVDYFSKDIKDLTEIIGELYDSPCEYVWEHALLWISKELIIRKSKKNTITYSDLLRLMDPKKSNTYTNKINTSNIYKDIKNRYKVALIDEFQDTDSVQLRILQEAFGNKSTHLLLMIGDPKQAIYSFRGGSLNTYLKAREQSDRIDLMSANYRSTKPLISILNKFFHEGLIRSRLPAKQLEPRSNEDFLKLNGLKEPLKILNLVERKQKGNEEVAKLESKSKIEAKIPKVIGSYLIELLNNNPKELTPSDICILVNRHDQAKNIHSYFSKVKLPSQLMSNENIFSREGALVLQIFINCIASPHDQKKIALLACSELMQWGKDKLLESKLNGDFDILSSKFYVLGKSFPKIGLLGCLSTFLEGKSIADLSNRGTLLSDLYQTSQLVDEQIYRQKLNVQNASIWLSRQRFQQSETTPDEYQPNSAISNNAINIITIHKSKGLQFKIVICPYLWQKPPDKKSYLWKDNENLLISKKYKWLKKYHSYQEFSRKESLKEAERLAYVALTRAKKQLIILWAKAADQEGNPLSEFLFGSELLDLKIESYTKEMMENSFKKRDLKVDIEDIYLIKNNNILNTPKSKLNLSLGQTPCHHIDNSWGRYSFSNWIARKDEESIPNNLVNELNEDLTFKNKLEEDLILSSNQKLIKQNCVLKNIKDQKWSRESPIGNFPRGSIAGTCLHKILERIEFNDLENSKTSSIIEEELRAVNINSSFIEPINVLLRRIVEIPLGGPLGDFKLKSLDSLNSIKELTFDIPICHQTNPINTLELSSIFQEDNKCKYGSDYSNRLMNLNIYSSGFLTGSIDQVFADSRNHKIAKWWVLDWKSNWIGNPLSKEDEISCGPTNYSIKNMDEEMYRHHYPLQAHLYLLALHRFLHWRLPNYSAQKHLGGYIYVFLRGIPDVKDLKEHKFPKKIPGLIVEPAPLERIKKLDLLIKT